MSALRCPGCGSSNRVTFHAHYDKKLRELVIKVTEYPTGDHVYEGEQ